jgi:mannitol 2-dehydrogenase
MIDYLRPGDAATVVARLSDPAIRIVSLTITEGGYYIDPASQKFDPGHPDIAFDAAHMAAPRTAFGLILAGLIARRAAGISALHRDELRQYPRQRPRDAKRRHRPRQSC